MVTKIMSSVLALLLMFSTLQIGKVEAAAENQLPDQIASKQLDREAQILASYLAKHNSPLQYHAQDFVDAAKTYNLDWKLVPAIAGVESTFGKFIPGGYNAWGWGVYGNQAIFFDSWREAIFTISKGLRENYFNKGLTEPYAINRVYAASPRWGANVSYFLSDIERYATEYKQQNPEKRVVEVISPTKIAATSALLVSN